MIGERTAAVKAFWERFKAETGCEAQHYHARTFSDPRFTPVTDEIANLARIGQKRGTAHLDMDFEISDIPRRNSSSMQMPMIEIFTNRLSVPDRVVWP